MAFTQQQAIALLSLLSGGRLITELEELLSLNTNDNFVAINSGSNDAKRIKIPLLRGYKGTYDASTNTPNLSNTSTDGRVEGDMYIVSVAGSTNFGGGTVVNLLVDDIIIYLNGKYVKVTGSLDLQGAYNNSSTKTITVDDIADGTLTVKDSATNSYRDGILQVKDTSDNTLFYVQKDEVYIKDKLGIGTETPSAKLEVDGNITVKDSNDTVTGSTHLKNFGLECERLSSYIRPNENNTKSLYIGGSSAGEKDWSLVRVFASQLGILGNVGIGNVTSPTGKLQVYEGGNSSYKTYETTNAGTIIQSYQSNNIDYKKTTDIVAGSDGTAPNTTPSEIRIFTRTQGATSVEERLRIDSEGNLGIGTTNPSEKLEVDGNVKASEYITGGFKVRDKGASNDTHKGFTIERTTTGTDPSGLSFYTESQSGALEIYTTMTNGFEFQHKVVVDHVDGITGNLTGDNVTVYSVTTNPVAFVSLPQNPTSGMIATINNAPNTITWRGEAEGGGTNTALVFYDGSSNKWIYH